MAEKPDITIIGPGVVGQVLGLAAFQAGYRIAAVAGGSQTEKAAAFTASVGGAKVLPAAQAAAAGRLVLLTVKDDAIETVCEQLAAEGGLRHLPLLAHCSGALGGEALRAAAAMGCAVGSMHPLQTFPDVETSLARLPGTYFFLEGDPPAVEPLEDLARALGGHPVRIDSQAKPLYHAAAVLSANYLTTLLDAALRVYESVGLERSQARQAVAPLLQATLENALRQGPVEALTGPIARGDANIVRRHLQKLRELQPEIERLYRTLGQATVELAARKGNLDEPTLQALRNALAKT
ncbi:MAG: DUF2520 domain-containing protein [Phycisphaerae bacterium]|nr:DUF2520 domain-containing protein [Phycisphaerae bacterium]